MALVVVHATTRMDTYAWLDRLRRIVSVTVRVRSLKERKHKSVKQRKNTHHDGALLEGKPQPLILVQLLVARLRTGPAALSDR